MIMEYGKLLCGIMNMKLSELAVKLSNMSELYCVFSANLQVYLQ